MKLFSKKQEKLIDTYLDMVNGILTVEGDDIKIEVPEDTYIYHSVGGLMADIEYNLREMGLL